MAAVSPTPLPDDPIRLPSPRPAPPRAAFPVWAAIVPVAGAVVLWQVTGSLSMLWFAALGPLLAAASILDAGRARRRARRRDDRDMAAASAAARVEIDVRHARERDALRRATPSVSGYAAAPDEIWRPVPGRADVLVLGTGEARSSVRVEGEGAAAGELRRVASRLPDAPVTIPLRAGVAVIGPTVAAAAVVRSLVVQACLTRAPGQLQLAAPLEPWSRALPHARATSGERLWVGGQGMTVPGDVDIPIVSVDDGVPPPRCAVVLRLTGPVSAQMTFEGTTTDIRVAPISVARASEIAGVLTARATALAGVEGDALPFDRLQQVPRTGGLGAPIGADRGQIVVVDLVEDGPHAVVVGVTGSGKSELLTTWIASMAMRYSPAEVMFMLVDFKGGRAFDVLRPLPHVTGIVTDLDDAIVSRAIDSLAAEIRARERMLGERGARDISEVGGDLPRLVVVVDEYAALTAQHPRLHELFADVAARGRALGMHLILATQRAAGIRDAVFANAPLRVALRVTDPADSRAVIGTADAAGLPGDAAGRGRALIRGASDGQPRPVRVSMCPPEAIQLIAAAAGPAPARRPWLAPLPARVPLAAVRMPGRVVIGVADEPQHQRQRLLTLPEETPGLLVVGRAGSGKSTALAAIAAQVDAHRVHRVPADPEGGWDALAALGACVSGDVIVADDLDLLLSRLPADYAAAAGEIVERVVREARGRGIRVVASAQRLSSATARLADQFPSHLILATSSRVEHATAGGDPAHHDPAAPPGRARWDGALVQVVETHVPPVPSRPHGQPWYPRGTIGLVASGGARTRATLHAWGRSGVEILTMQESSGALREGAVVWGTPDAWVGRWRALAAAAPGAVLVVEAACAPDLRLITGRRELPPFISGDTDGAWLVDADGRIDRIVLPTGDSRTARRLRAGEHRT